jgi:hypothetical protein
VDVSDAVTRPVYVVRHLTVDGIPVGARYITPPLEDVA